MTEKRKPGCTEWLDQPEQPKYVYLYRWLPGLHPRPEVPSAMQLSRRLVHQQALPLSEHWSTPCLFVVKLPSKSSR